MPTDSNAALLHRAWQAVADGDVRTLEGLIDEKAEWKVIGDSPWAGRHQGFAAIVDLLVRVGEEMESFDAQIIDTLASDSRVLLLYHVAAVVGEHALNCDFSLLARIENRRITRVSTGALDPDEPRRFWAAQREPTRSAL